jgi:hypothetical protein
MNRIEEVKKSTTDWATLINNDTLSTIKLFAQKKISGRTASNIFKNTEYAGPFRTLVRENGVNRATQLARWALKRRNLI